MRLSKPMQDFILHWGEMGARWGVNRSVAQVHALLFLSERALPADEIAETLSIARSNVSGAIRELQGWKLVQVSRQLGDRRDHFTTQHDILEMVRVIVEGRREREFRPTMDALETVLAETEADGETAEAVRTRMREMLETMRLCDRWYAEVSRLPKSAQMALLKAGGTIARLLPGKG